MQNEKKTVTNLSVIIPVYNAEKYIYSTIQSILDQSFTNFEVIIIDDKSKDNSRQIVSEINDPRIKLISMKKNEGPGAARNIGINSSSGEWLTFIDSDDHITPNRFEKIFKIISNDSELTFIADQIMFCFDDKNKLIPWKVKKSLYWGRKNVLDLYAKVYIDKQLVIKPFIKKSLIKEHNISFYESSFYGEDLYLYAKALHYSRKSLLIRDALYLYRLAPGSLTTFNNKIESLNKVLMEMIKDSNYSPVEKKYIRKRINYNQNEINFRILSNYLRKRKIIKAIVFFLTHLGLIFTICRKFLPFLQYRFKAISKKIHLR